MPNQTIQKLFSEFLPKACNKLPDFLSKTITLKPPSRIAINSHYSDSISNNIFQGNSRNWGDANNEVKLRSLNQIIDEAKKQSLNDREIALALSVTYIESGFNPDAAASSTSASGLGQFINKTGAAYGLNKDNRFNIIDNSKALVSELKYNIDRFRNDTSTDEESKHSMAYAGYHDGANITDETILMSENKIPTLEEKFYKYLKSEDCDLTSKQTKLEWK